MRAPYLRVGGNEQFSMMTDQFFAYDSSITAPLGRVPIWPYTLHYRYSRGPIHAYPLEYTAGIHYNSGPYSHQCFTYGKIILFVSGAEQALSNLYLASRLRRPYLVF